MNKEEVWKIFCKKNPNFLIEGYQHTFTSKGVKQLFDQTWNSAFDHALLVSKNLDKATKKSIGNKSVFEDLFGNIENYKAFMGKD